MTVGSPDDDHGSKLADIDRLPDIPSAVNHPIFRKLEVLSGIFFRRQNPVIIDPREFNDELLLTNTKSEAFLYSTCLTEFIHRVAKGIIPVAVMEENFSEEMIKEQVMSALNLIVSVGEVRITRNEQSVSQEWLPPEEELECAPLENILRDIIDMGVLTLDELRKGCSNRELSEFLDAKFGPRAEHKPTFVARYYSSPASQQSEIRRRIEKAHTYMDLSKIAREATAADPNVDDSEIVFKDMEAPTLRRGTTLMSAGQPAPAPESAPHQQKAKSAAEKNEVIEMVQIPGLAVEMANEGDEIPFPLLLEGEVYTFGTDPINDYVVKSEEGSGTEPVHGIIFAKGGKVFVKAVSAPLKLEKEHYEVNQEGEMIRTDYPGTNLVLTNAEKEVEPGRVFHLMPRGKVFEDPTSCPCFAIREQAKVNKTAIRAELKSRHRRFMTFKADKLFKILRNEDPRTSSNLLEEIAVAEKKMEMSLDTARRYGMELYEGDEYRAVFNEVFQPLAAIVNNAIEAYYRKMARAMMRHLVDNSPLSLTKQLTGEFTKSNDRCAELRDKITNLFSFAESHAIPVMPRERGANLFEQVLEQVEAQRLALIKKQQEEAAEQARRNDEKMQEMRDRAEKLRQLRAPYTDVHLGDNEVLDENTKFEYVGPAVRITDGTAFTRVDPFLIDEITIGDHPANTHRVPKKRTPKYRTADFMARIRKSDESMRMTWLAGSLSFTGTGGVLASPNVRLSMGQVFHLSSYHVSVEDRHAYTLQALKTIAPGLAKELIEVIFNMDETSEGQDEEALKNLQTLVEKGYVDIKFVEGIIAYGMGRLMGNIMSWNEKRPLKAEKSEISEREPMQGEPMQLKGIVQALQEFMDAEAGQTPLQDAHHLRTMKMLADVSCPEGFLRKIGVGGFIGTLKAEARRRAKAYCGMDGAKNRMLEAASAPSSLRKIRNFFGTDEKEKNVRELRELEERASSGAVQIARLHEMGLLALDRDVAELPEASVEYLDRIREIIKTREILKRFGKGLVSVDDIMVLNGRSMGLKISDVLSIDEIETANHNIEVNLDEKATLEYYIGKMAVATGRKAFRKAIDAEDPRAPLTFIRALRMCGMLADTDLMQLPLIPVENVRVTLEELENNARYLDEQDKLRIERGRDARAEVVELQKIALEVDRLLEKAAREEDLELLLNGAEKINDNILALRMERSKMTMPAIRKIDDMSPGEKRALSMVARVDLDRNWEDIRRDYRKLALELAKKEAGKAMACDDADYRMALVDEAVDAGLVTYDEIGVTLEKMRSDIENTRALTRMRLMEVKKADLRAKYALIMAKYQDALDNLDYLEEIDLDGIDDPEERQIAYEAISLLSAEKLTQIGDNIYNNKDVPYMMALEESIREMMPDIDKKRAKA